MTGMPVPPLPSNPTTAAELTALVDAIFNDVEPAQPADAAPLPERVRTALDFALSYGNIDGDHHKAWVIDQMVRALTGPAYEHFLLVASDGEDGPDTYTWDPGIAP